MSFLQLWDGRPKGVTQVSISELKDGWRKSRTINPNALIQLSIAGKQEIGSFGRIYQNRGVR